MPEQAKLTSHTSQLGAPWEMAANTAARGTALHLAMRACLMRPELGPDLAAASELTPAQLTKVSECADALRA